MSKPTITRTANQTLLLPRSVATGQTTVVGSANQTLALPTSIATGTVGPRPRNLSKRLLAILLGTVSRLPSLLNTIEKLVNIANGIKEFLQRISVSRSKMS